jgi:Cdc6-like AAA superfamily ATPase
MNVELKWLDDRALLRSRLNDTISVALFNALQLNSQDAAVLLATCYLSLIPAPARRDVVRESAVLRGLLSPDRFPLARWPVHGRYPLFLMQQAAINHTVTELKESGIAGIYGPPGIGKTTLLRDVVAKVVLDRAIALACFERAGDAFTHAGRMKLGQAYSLLYTLHASLIGHEIVLASSNNNAVENISGSIPGID